MITEESIRERLEAMTRRWSDCEHAMVPVRSVGDWCVHCDHMYCDTVLGSEAAVADA